MKYVLSSTVILMIMMGCSGTTPKVKVVETKEKIVDVKIPKVEVKQEDPFDIAKKSCLDGNAQGCIDFGYIMFDEKDYKLAKTSFGMAYDYGNKDGGNRGYYFVECMEKNAQSCNMLGTYLEKGWGGKQDYELARVAYQQSIDLGNTDSFGSLAHLYDKGLGGAKSYVKAHKFFEASCNAGTTDVNYENCYNTGKMYSKGEGVRQNKFKAVELYRKACNGGNATACSDLGYMYSYGKGVRQDKATAQMYYGKACDMGSDLGCSNYAKNNK